MADIAKTLNRSFQILVPLNQNEQHISQEIKQILSGSEFVHCIAEGAYPLFNWNRHTEFYTVRKMDISKYVNPDRYILINVNF